MDGMLEPTPKYIPKHEPAVHERVFALNQTLMNHWLKCVIIMKVYNKHTKQGEFIVSYEPTENDWPVLVGEEESDDSGDSDDSDDIDHPRQICLKQMAFTVPTMFLLPVGSRVIAKFKDDVTKHQNCNGLFYAGIVAEKPRCPCMMDQCRYLIFFDDGYVQYVLHGDVRLVYESSHLVWNDVHPNSYDFIKDYLIKYPEWPLVKLTVGQRVATEWHGSWMISRVVALDNSLAKVHFDDDGRDEWIFRGSCRLRPISKQLLEKQEKLVNKGILGKQQTFRPDPSTSGSRNFYEELLHFTGSSRSWQGIDLSDPQLFLEYQGSLEKLKIPANTLKKMPPHTCGISCVGTNSSPSIVAGGSSPMVIPVFFGWNRQVFQEERHYVCYTAPCGVELMNEKQLARYLEATNSNLSIDYFSFDYDVDCNSKFVPSRVLVNNPDISENREKVRVQFVNSIDYDFPPSFEYITEIEVGPGVSINTDKNFLVCCDCTDNCQDQSKCACQQLTLKGKSFERTDDEFILVKGYEYKRLNEQVKSGIYECNSRCQCKQTCFNRTTQNGVMWPLQLFKTSKKGWGIRAIYDMPKGTFVCNYTGQIINDVTAEYAGREIQDADEYFLEMDYIEVNERLKSDYESDVTDIEEGENCEKLTQDSGNSENDLKTRKNPFIDGNNRRRRITAKSLGSSQGKQRKKKGRRQELYGNDADSYVIDARIKGNIGRFLNHSCSPNVFAQNVFVDTVDLRFPLTALFTNTLVKAGSELTWDYCYQVGCVPGKVIYCGCNSRDCHGRLI